MSVSLNSTLSVQARIDIADDSNTSLVVRLLLAVDENADVRFALAENHNIDKSVLNLLAEDAHPYVAHRAQKTLARLAAGAVFILQPVPVLAPVLSVSRSASSNALGSKLGQLLF